MKGCKNFQRVNQVSESIVSISAESKLMLSVTSELDDFTRRLQEIASLPDGWHFGQGSAPSAERVDMAASVGDLMRRAGAETREVYPSEDGGILVAGYCNDDTMEVFCGADNAFRFSLEKNGEDIVYLEGLSISMMKEKIRRHCWKIESSSGSFTQDTSVKRKDAMLVSLFKMPVTKESRWYVSAVLSG